MEIGRTGRLGHWFLRHSTIFCYTQTFAILKVSLLQRQLPNDK